MNQTRFEEHERFAEILHLFGPMRSAVFAGEASLRLLTTQLDALITKYIGKLFWSTLAGQPSPQFIHEVRGGIEVGQGKPSQRRLKVDKIALVRFG